MKTFKLLLNLAIVAAVGWAAYNYRSEIGDTALLVRDRFFVPAPCSKPITYSIGSFDPQFGLSKEQFVADVAAAAKIWEADAGKKLFQYDPQGDGKGGLASDELKLNLIYDYRQRATAKMQAIGVTINDNLSSYDALKAKYDSLKSEYSQEKAQVEQLTAQFDAEKQQYETQVAYWNDRGGAPRDQYAALQAQHADLDSKSSVINQKISGLNETADEANSAASILNQLASTLNLNVSTYNSVGASTGPEFDEGEYVEDSAGRHIDIYQFSDNDKLVRVLAHELGHSLGLDHVDDPKAIMYKLNQSTNEVLTAADKSELKRVCGANI